MMNMAGMTPMMQQQFLMMQQQQLQQQQLQQQQLQQQQSQQQQSTQQSMGFPGMGSMMMPGVMGMAHPIAMMQTMPASQSGDQGVQARPQAGVNEGGKRRTGQQHGPAQVPQGDFSGPGEQPGFEHAEQGEQHDRQGQRREPQQPRQPKWKPTRVLELLVIEKKKPCLAVSLGFLTLYPTVSRPSTQYVKHRQNCYADLMRHFQSATGLERILAGQNAKGEPSTTVCSGVAGYSPKW